MMGALSLTQVIIGLIILFWSLNVFYKLNRGFTVRQSLDIFYQKSERTEFLELLREISSDGLQEKSSPYNGKVELGFFFNDEKYFLNERGEFGESFESNKKLLDVYSSHDSKGRDLRYAVVRYRNDIYINIEVIRLFYKFDFDQLYNLDAEDKEISRLIPGFWNLSKIEKKAIPSNRTNRSRLNLWFHGLNNNLRSKDIWNIQLHSIKSKV